MPTPAGGLRDRLIFTALFETVEEIISTLGWLDSGRQHLPINLIGRAVDEHETVPLNTLAVSAEGVDGEDGEMGSLLEEQRHPYFVDFYAEDDAVGAHLIGDIREALKGKHAGRTGPVLHVFDSTLATPALAFSCVIENVVSDRAHGFTEEYRRHWYSVSLDIVDDVDGPVADVEVGYPPLYADVY